MSLIETVRKKTHELSKVEVARLLDVDYQSVVKWLKGKSFPAYRNCEQIVDLWYEVKGQKSEVKEEVKDEPKKEESIDKTIEDLISKKEEPVVENDLWQGRDVCLCLPMYKEIHPKTMFCIMAMWDKTRMRLEMRDNDSMIARSRNQLAKRFLDSGAQWSVWFDSDMIFPFGNPNIYATFLGESSKRIGAHFLGLNTIDRLISWGKTVVGGCYWDRTGQGRLIAAGTQPILNPIPSNVLYAAKFCGTGCLLVHRQVFLDIQSKFPDILSKDNIGNESGFFTPIQSTGRMLGEDESFAWRATEAGHPTYIDLGLICGHYGEVCHSLPAGGSKI